jgi:hypothetical protein
MTQTVDSPPDHGPRAPHTAHQPGSPATVNPEPPTVKIVRQDQQPQTPSFPPTIFTAPPPSREDRRGRLAGPDTLVPPRQSSRLPRLRRTVPPEPLEGSESYLPRQSSRPPGRSSGKVRRPTPPRSTPTIFTAPPPGREDRRGRLAGPDTPVPPRQSSRLRPSSGGAVGGVGVVFTPTIFTAPPLNREDRRGRLAGPELPVPPRRSSRLLRPVVKIVGEDWRPLRPSFHPDNLHDSNGSGEPAGAVGGVGVVKDRRD